MGRKSEDYFGDSMEPIKCAECESTEIKTRTMDSINSKPCEIEYYCDSCKKVLGYWAYGSFDPAPLAHFCGINKI